MAKGPWEIRTTSLIKRKSAWYHKCADRPAAGRARLDLIGSTLRGEFFIVEVKEAPERKRTHDWLSYKKTKDATCLSPLQRAEMQDAVMNRVIYVKVAVGIGNTLYVFDFKDMEQKYGQETPWPLFNAEQLFVWTGPKGWETLEWEWI